MLTVKSVVLLTVLAYINAIQHVNSSQVISLSGESEDDNTLRQALYLVKLLKTDFMNSLRNNQAFEGNVTDEVNSTCSEDEYNSTTPTIVQGVTVNIPPTMTTLAPEVVQAAAVAVAAVSSNNIASPVQTVPHLAPALPAPNALPAAPVQPANPAAVVAQPPNSIVPPPLMMQYAPPGNVPPAENYKYPYRHFHRQMMPDYDYYGHYDDPIPRYGGYRRFIHEDPIVPAQGNYRRFLHYGQTSQPVYQNHQGLSNKGYRRFGGDDDVKMNENVQKDVTVTETSLPPLTEVSEGSKTTRTVSTTITPSSSTEVKAVTNGSSIKIFNETTAQNNNNIVTNRNRKVTKKQVQKNIKKAKRGMFRRRRINNKKTTTQDHDILSLIADELSYEFKRTTKNIAANNVLRRHQMSVAYKSTMKLFLPGSSKMPIPFPENNAFCHLYPQSTLCGAGML